MTPLALSLAGVAGVVGLWVGAVLVDVIAAGVDGDAPSPRRYCPTGDAVAPWRRAAPLVGWVALGGRCKECGERMPALPALVQAATGLAFAGVTGGVLTVTPVGPAEAVSVALQLAALLYLAAVSIALSYIDLATHRLPNAIVLPSYPVAIVLLGASSALVGDGAALVRAGIGMAALYGFYFLLRLARPGAMGGGDVKLAGVLGLYLGWAGWGALAVGAFAAFLAGGLVGLVLIALRRASRHTALPFGPFMILGAWIGLVAGA